MGTFKLISQFSMDRLNKAEKLAVLTQFRSYFPTTTATDPDDGGSPGTVSLLSASEDGVPALNFSAEMVQELDDLIARLTELNTETTSFAETPEMATTESDRDTTGNFIVNQILNYDKLGTTAKRAAGKALEPAFRQYRGFTSLPIAQKMVTVDGLLHDLRKPEYAEYITEMGIDDEIAELESLNNRYKELLKERTQAQSARSEAGNAVTIGKEAQDLLDDMCALANASSLLQPSEEATKFIASITQVFKNARSAYKARAKGEDEEEENPDTVKPADEEYPDSEQPGTEPPGEGTGEEETPNPDGQQPTEPQPGVDTDGDGSPEVV